MADSDLLESLGFHPKTRWTKAEHKFLEIFYGKEFLTVYEKLGAGKNEQDSSIEHVFPIPSLMLPKTLTAALPSISDDKRGENVKITRPRTAELTLEQKSRLDQFRELDLIAFTRPFGFGTPRPTPIATAGTNRQSDVKTSHEKITQYDALKQHMTHKLSDQAQLLVDDLITQASNIQQHSKPVRLRSIVNKSKSPSQEIVSFSQERNLIRSDVFGKLIADKDLRDDQDGHLVYRKVIKKYMLPKAMLYRRLTPLSNIASKPLLNDMLEHLNPPSTDSPEDLAISDLLSSAHEDPNSSSREERSSPKSFSIGCIFPLDYFLDQEWISQLNKRLQTGGPVRCMARNTASYRLDGVEGSFQKLIQATQNPDLWSPCHIIASDPSNVALQIQWKNGDDSTLRLKSYAEVWIPECGETLNTVRIRLERAQDLRLDFERDVALSQTITIAKNLLEPYLSPFPKRMVEGILQSTMNSVVQRSSKHRKADSNPLEPESVAAQQWSEWQREDSMLTLLTNVSHQLKSLFIDAELKTLISRNNQFQSLLPSVNMIHPWNKSYPLNESVKHAKIDHVSTVGQHLLQNLPFLRTSLHVISFLHNLKTEIEALFSSNVGSMIKDRIPRPRTGKTRNGVHVGAQYIVPSLDASSDVLSYTALDFIGASEWFEDHLTHIVTERIPVIINHFFAQLLIDFKLPPETTIPEPFVTLRQRTTRYATTTNNEHTQMFERLGKFVSYIGASIATPLLYKEITAIRSMMERGSLRIRLDVQHLIGEDHLPIFHYGTDLDEISSSLKAAFSRWIQPLDGVSVASIISVQPANYASLGELAEEMIDDSIKGANEYLTVMLETFLPLMSVEAPPLTSKDVDSFLEYLKTCLKNVYEVRKHRALRLRKVTRGMFCINTEFLASELLKWEGNVLESLSKGASDRVRLMCDEVIHRCEAFFSVPTPTTFDETRQALKDLISMADTMQWIHREEVGICKLKDFMDQQGWLQPDQDFCVLIQARLCEDQFRDFFTKRSEEVRVVSEELRAIIEKDMDTLSLVWNAIDGMVSKICAQPIALRHLELARRKSSVSGTLTQTNHDEANHAKEETNIQLSPSFLSYQARTSVGPDPSNASETGQSIPVIGAVIQVDDSESGTNPNRKSGDTSNDTELNSNHVTPSPSGNFLVVPDPDGAMPSMRRRQRRSSLSFSTTSANPDQFLDPIVALEKARDQISHTLDLAVQIRQKADGIESGPRATELESVIAVIESRKHLVETLVRIQKNLDTWRTSTMNSLVIPDVVEHATEYLKIIEDSPLSHAPLLQTSKELLKMYLDIELPLIKRLRNPNFNADHIMAIQKLVHFPFDPDTHSIQDVEENLRRNELLALAIHLEPIESSASKEQVILNVISEIKERYGNMRLEVHGHEANHNLMLVSSLAIYASVLESDLLTVQMLISNAALEKHLNELKPLEKKLQIALNAMQEWEAMQPLMISVHGVFESEEVRVQLSVELRRFKVFETGYRVIISHVERHSLFSDLVEYNPDLPVSISEIRTGLRKVIDDVQGWLDSKRFVFPRLFFLSDLELLELVSVAKEAGTISRQLSRYFFFDNVAYTTTKDKETIVTGIKEGTEEFLLLANPISTRGLGVEQWLAKLEGEVKYTLKKNLIAKLTQLNFEEPLQIGRLIYERMVFDAPPQICLLVYQIIKTSELENALSNKDSQSILDFSLTCREDIARLSVLLKQSRTKSVINTWKALISLSFYYRDWAQELISEKAHELTSFVWLKGMRYVFQEEEDNVVIQQFYSKMLYGFEYLGSSKHFFSFNISRRAFSSIWSCLDMKVGVLGYGPDAAAKEECLRDFAKAVGRFIVYFNCSVGVSSSLLTRLVTGMAMTNSFLMLSKLDHLPPDAFSALSNAISSLREFSERKDTGFSVSFMGRVLKLPSITSIPLFGTISSKSLKEQQLLSYTKHFMKKVFFAPPSLHIAALTRLAVAGFTESQDLSRRMTIFFTKLKDQLSRQTHYDFSLRTLNTVICIAERVYENDTTANEKVLLASCLRDYLLPKLLFDDIPIFYAILTRTFGNDAVLVQEAASCEQNSAPILSLTINEPSRQFYDVIDNRQHGLVLGKVGVGKSSLIQRCSGELGLSVYLVNPRAVSREFLYGFEESAGYQKGIFEHILSSHDRKNRGVILMDGPIEATWADTFVTMLQKTEGGSLCLANGKRIKLPDEITILIETESLDHAAMSFVSHFNVIFLRSEWNWRFALESWLRKMNPSKYNACDISQIQIDLRQQFAMHMENLIIFLSDAGVRVKLQVLFNTCLNILECVLQDFDRNISATNRDARPTFPIEDIFYYAIIWSFGACISTDRRNLFDSFIRKQLRQSCSSCRLALSLQNFSGQVYDMLFAPSSGLWSSSLDPLTPTSIRILSQQRSIMRMLVNHKKDIMIIGDFGTQKTTTASNMLREITTSNSHLVAHAFPLNQTSSTTEILNVLQKALVPDGSKSGDMFAPVNGTSLACLVDDLQACSSNQDGSRTLWEFLRHLLGYKGYWSNPQMYRKTSNLFVVGILNLLRNGVIVLPERFLRLFGIIQFQSEDILEETCFQFQLQMSQKLSTSGISNPSARLTTVIRASLELLRLLKRRFTLSSESPFYFFSSTDLSKMFRGLELVDATYFKSLDAIFNVWSYESRRIFKDRIDKGDLTVFQDCIETISKQYFHSVSPSIDEYWTEFSVVHLENPNVDSLNYDVVDSDQMIEDAENIGTRGCFRAVDTESIFLILDSIKSKYPTAFVDLPSFSMFPDAAFNFSRLCRAISIPSYSSCVLLSRIGKDISLFLIKAVSLCLSVPLEHFSFHLKDLEEWRQFLRKHIAEAGLKDKKFIICVSLHSAKETPEEFWSDLCTLLDGSWSRHLWSGNEYEDLLNKFYHQFHSSSSNSNDSNQRIKQQPGLFSIAVEWAKRLKMNIKVIIRVNSADKGLHALTLKYPFIICRSVIQAHADYDIDEYTFIVKKYIHSLAPSIEESDLMKVTEVMVKVYLLAKLKFDLSIWDLLASIRWFFSRWSLMREQLELQKSDMERALFSVHSLTTKFQAYLNQEKSELETLPLKLHKLTEEARNLEESMKACRIEAVELSERIREKRKHATRLAFDQEQEILNLGLNNAHSEYDRRVQNLGMIDKRDIEDLKMFVMPPQNLSLISDGLCILFDRPIGWGETRKLFSSRNFFQRMLDLDLDSVTETKVEQLSNVVEQTGFVAEKGPKTSPPIKAIGLWMKALVHYKGELRKKIQSQTVETLDYRQISSIEADTVEEERSLCNLEKRIRESEKNFEHNQNALREHVGRLTLLKEVFSPTSIFAAANPDRVSENQWIQQAFHHDSRSVYFEHSHVAGLHQDYQTELEKLEEQRKELEIQLKASESCLEEMKDILSALNETNLSELLTPSKVHNPVTESAKALLFEMLGIDPSISIPVILQKLRMLNLRHFVRSKSARIKQLAESCILFQRVAFYDSKQISSSAISPHQTCPASFLIRDAFLKALSYNIKHERILNRLEDGRKRVLEKKLVFNTAWEGIYKDNSEFWTFEVILEKHKEISLALSSFDPSQLKSHLCAIKKNPFLVRILVTGAMCLGWSDKDAFERISSDPKNFLDSILHLHLNDQSISKPIVNELGAIDSKMQSVIIGEFCRLYLDILSNLPNHLQFKLLTLLNEKELVICSGVSKKWHDIINQQHIWKWMSHRKGWGIWFTYPKGIDWMLFHHSLCQLRTRRLLNVVESFRTDILSFSGVKAQKRFISFLRRIPEYVHMDKLESSPSKKTSDLVNLELVNEIFIRLEDIYFDMVSRDTRLLEDEQAAAIESPFKKVLVTALSAETGQFIGSRYVHELIIEKCAKLRCLHGCLDRAKKIISRGEKDFKVEYRMGAFIDPCPPGIVHIPEISEALLGPVNLFQILSDYYKVILSYHRGVEMGKYVQFQHRYIFSQTILASQLTERIKETDNKIKCITGDLLWLGNALSYLTSNAGADCKTMLCGFWDIVSSYFPVRSYSTIMDAHFPKFNLFSHFWNLDFIRLNVTAFVYASGIVLVTDPHRIAQPFLSDVSLRLGNGIVFLDGGSKTITETLHMYTNFTGAICVHNVDTNQGLFDRIVNFSRERSACHAPIYIYGSNNLKHSAEVHVTKIDFTLHQETFQAYLADSLLTAVNPRFCVEHNILVSQLHDSKEMLESWFTRILAMCRHSDDIDDSLMYEVITYQQKASSVGEDATVLTISESGLHSRMKAYYQLILFTLKLWTLMCRLGKIRGSSILSPLLFIDAFREAMNSCQIQTDSDGNLPRFAMQVFAEAFIAILGNRLLWSVPVEQRTALSVALVITAIKFKGGLLERDEALMLNLLEKRLTFNKEENLFEEWIKKDSLHLSSDRPALLRIIEGLVDLNESPSSLWKGLLAESFDKRLSVLQKILVHILFSPETINLSLEPILNEFSLWTREARDDGKLLGAAQDSSLPTVIIFAEEFAAACRRVIQLSETFEESHLQLSVLNDRDKEGSGWMQKIETATSNGSWVMVRLDPFWLSQLDKIYRVSRTQSQGFKVWIISSPSWESKFPKDLLEDSFVLFYDEYEDESFVSKHVESNCPNTIVFYYPYFAILLRFHFCLLQLIRDGALSAMQVQPSETDLMSAWQLITFGASKKIALDTTTRIILERIYNVSDSSGSLMKTLFGLWQESEQVVEGLVKQKGARLTDKMTRDQFLGIFNMIKQDLFSLKSRSVYSYGYLVNVPQKSRQLSAEILTLLWKNAEMQLEEGANLISNLRIKKELASFLQRLSLPLSIRLIFENLQHGDSASRFYLLAEANNFIRLLRRVRSDMHILLTSFSNGYPTASAKKTLESVAQNKIAPAWIRRSHPSCKPLDDWIECLAKQVSFLEQWIHWGTPKSLDFGIPFSFRSFLHMVKDSSPDDLPLVVGEIRGPDEDFSHPAKFALHGLYFKGLADHPASDANIGRVEKGRLKRLRPLFVGCRQIAAAVDGSSQLFKSETVVDLTATDRSSRSSRTDHRVYECPVLITDLDTGSSNFFDDECHENYLFSIPMQHCVPTSALNMCNVHALIDTPSLSSSLDPHNLHSHKWSLRGSLIEEGLAEVVIDTQAHITAYMCSTTDTQTERQYLFDNAISHLAQMLSHHQIDFHLVDLKHSLSPLTSDTALQYLEAAISQIRRSTFFVGLFGARMGPMINFREFSKLLISKGIDPQDFVSLGDRFSICEAEVALGMLVFDSQFCERGNRQYLFLSRDTSFPRSVPKSFRSQFEAEDSAEKERLITLWTKCQESFPTSCFSNYPAYFASIEGRSVRMGGLEILNNQVHSDILKSALMIIRLKAKTGKNAQILSGMKEVEFFAGRNDFIDRIHDAFGWKTYDSPARPTSRLFQMITVTAQSGMGKTALLLRLAKDFGDDNYLILDNFVRSWAGSFDVDAMLRRFCIMIHNFLGDVITLMPPTFLELKLYFIDLLQDVVFRGNKILIVVDGVDRLVDNQRLSAHSTWIPSPSELGNETYSNTFWLFSAADDTIIQDLHSNCRDALSITLPVLSEDDIKSVISHRAKISRLRPEPSFISCLRDKPIASCPLFLKVVMEELSQNVKRVESEQHGLDIGRLNSLPDAFNYFFNRVEVRHGSQLIKRLFTFLAFARNGLREQELVAVLAVDTVKWNMIFDSVREYVTKTTSGNIIPFHEQFTAAIKERYIPKDEEDICHKHLADFYLSLCDPLGEQAWNGTTFTRAADITYHQLRGQVDVGSISSVMCSLGYMSAVFASRRSHELPPYFAEAIKMAVLAENTSIRSKLTDYCFFVERHAEYLSKNPELALSMSLSLPEGFCSHVQQEGNTLYQRKAVSGPFLRTFSIQEPQLEMIAIGQHSTDIIRIVVLPVKGLGKCCLSVSHDCTVRAWNIDTFLFLKDLLRSPIGADFAVDACFSLNQAELMAVGTHNGHILIFNLEAGICSLRLESAYLGGTLCFSEDISGVWQRGKDKQKNLEWVPFTTKDSLLSMSHAIKKIHRVIARSDDGQRILLLVVEKRRYIVVMSSKRMTEVCRFVEDNVSDSCIGKFSPSKDLLAVLLISGDIMVYKVDNHSKLSLLRVKSDEKVSTFAISSDDRELLFATQSGHLIVCGLDNGHILKKVAVGDNIVLSNICIATSKGQERMLLTHGFKICTCDTQSYFKLNSNSKDVPLLEVAYGYIPIRHSTAVTSVFHVQRPIESGSKTSLVSVSRDGHIRQWEYSKASQKYVPSDDIPTVDDVNACRILEMFDFSVMTSGTAAIIWSIAEKKEVLRITHKQVLKDAWLAKNRVNDCGLTLYTWAIDGKLNAWKILGRVHFILTYQPEPLFTLDATTIPKFPLSQDKSRLLYAHDSRAILSDSRSGAEIWSMVTNHNEPILSLSWCDFGNASSFGILCTTKTSLYKNEALLSYGGALGDNFSLQTCQADMTGRYVAYSAVDTGDGAMARRKSSFAGIIVVIQNDVLGKPHHRVATFRHESVHISHWCFMHDSRFVVTIGSDHFIRIWLIHQALDSADVKQSEVAMKIYKTPEYIHRTREPYAMFPLRSPATSLAVSRCDYLVYVGTDAGDVITFKLEF